MTEQPASLRIDRLLFFLRLTKSRSMAQAFLQKGHVRLNGQRVTDVSRHVRAGDVLTLPCADGARVLHIETLPSRRGPANEAMACYSEIENGMAVRTAL